MEYFVPQKINMFLAVVRKYMQMRGGLSQKELAEMVEVNDSTMSRFLNQKTKELDPQLIAKITAKLAIPLHEMIDFITEEATEKFKKLVRFYKDDEGGPLPEEGAESSTGTLDESFEAAFNPRGSAQRTVKATLNWGGKRRTIPFEAQGLEEGELTLKEKLERLTPRQKAYISEFLNLDLEGRDLMVDLGNALFRYFKQKGVEF